jgi:prolyl-tRNA synthetase
MGERLRVELDVRDIRGGEKTWQHIKKGTPIRAEVGPRDMQADSLFVARRDQGIKEKKGVSRNDFIANICETLDSMQKNLFDRALALRESRTKTFTDYNEFAQWFTPKNEDKPEIHGGFAIAYWSPDADAAKEINEKLGALKVSARCIPLNDKAPVGKCLFTGRQTSTRVIFAKNY